MCLGFLNHFHEASNISHPFLILCFGLVLGKPLMKKSAFLELSADFTEIFRLDVWMCVALKLCFFHYRTCDVMQLFDFFLRVVVFLACDVAQH